MSLEVLAWGVLNKGQHSDQLTIKLNSLLGAAFTRDVRAVPLLLEALRGTNAMLRTVAIKLATSYGDGPLQLELGRLLREEKVWYVRLEVIQAIGALRCLFLRETLKEIVGNPKTLTEEKAAAIVALVRMYDAIGPEELKKLIQSNRAGLRQLACELVSHLDLHAYAHDITALLSDSSPDVRMEALYTLGLLKVVLTKEQLEPLLHDSSPQVAITAAWYATLRGMREGPQTFSRFLGGAHPEWRWLAAAALSVAGKNGMPLAIQEMQENADPYVRANLAIGCIGQRESVEKACDVLFTAFFSEKQALWMWNQYPLFRCLTPSNLSHVGQIPNYPKVIDQMTRLDILTILSIMRAPKAQEAVRGFLKNDAWGVAGAASATLLEEGDEEALSLVRALLEEKDQKIRVQAALILALLGSDPAAVKVLQEAYPHLDREMRVHVLEALGHIGDPASIPFLIDILKEPFQMLRVVAASALIQCLYH
jgi:HEAT repeat protein